MEHTFMTIHNLSRDANVLFASDSIADILGYQPDEILGKSSFDYFHPDEVPFARSVHSRGVLLDKAAVLHYLRVQNRDGQWISCECCFTVVHDVLVACTSIYRRGEKSERRAIEAPQVRRLFSSSPRDPRYHMLEHLSPKFKMPPMEREPRAALILNRFTQTLTVMFATNAVSSILGVSPDQLKGKSFYECIDQNCWADAINCLESAKANDSIAYLRFWYRDPRRPEDFDDEASDSEDSSDSDGGAQLGASQSPMEVDRTPQEEPHIKAEPLSPETSKAEILQSIHSHPSASSAAGSSSMAESQGHQTHLTVPTPDAAEAGGHHGAGNPPQAPHAPPRNANQRHRNEPIPTFELEAVVSCTSDGLVVILRKARPMMPALHPPLMPLEYQNGFFAAPWGARPINPQYPPEQIYQFRPPLLPQYMPVQEHVKQVGGPPTDDLMSSIRDVAVFAWALVGINGTLAAHSRGVPQGEAQPPDGIPIWDPSATKSQYSAPENQAAVRWARMEGYPHGAAPSSLSAHFSRVSNGISQAYGGGSSFTHTMGYASYTHGTAPSWPSSGPMSSYAPQSQEPWADAAARYAQQQQPPPPPSHQHRPQHGDRPTTQPTSPGDGPPPAYSVQMAAVI
ncbi:hypothetical protein PG994_000575 [Apiospora phragmitis]|uniref:PAS domain-containing protein n=1 Tax=Apiospora phragmitis TaxID=2905665 RepID=A0ABR1X6L6_9PEZI